MKILEQLTEEKLFQLMASRYTGLIDLNVENKQSPIDWYWPEGNIYMEGKCRKEHRLTLFIQKDKWDALRGKEKGWYVNSTPKGIYVWNVKEIEEPIWFKRSMQNSQEFENQSIVKKLVGELRVDKAIQIDHLLLK